MPTYGEVRAFEADCPIAVASARLEQSLSIYILQSLGNSVFYSYTDAESLESGRTFRLPDGELALATSRLWLYGHGERSRSQVLCK